MLELYIANKNYSSWSLRPWVLMRVLDIPFAERLIRFGDSASWAEFGNISPSRKVPCLVDNETVVWDSFSIADYLAEDHPRVWPATRSARAWARSAAAEMHSGFGELRNRCSMTCGVRVRLKEFPPALARDVERLSALWNDGLQRHGGPFLAGSAFTAVDAFFAPVAFRIQSYSLSLAGPAADYALRLLELQPMRDWYAAALAETFRDESHEADMMQIGSVTQDLRAH